MIVICNDAINRAIKYLEENHSVKEKYIYILQRDLTVSKAQTAKRDLVVTFRLKRVFTLRKRYQTRKQAL